MSLVVARRGDPQAESVAVGFRLAALDLRPVDDFTQAAGGTVPLEVGIASPDSLLAMVDNVLFSVTKEKYTTAVRVRTHDTNDTLTSNHHCRHACARRCQ